MAKMHTTWAWLRCTLHGRVLAASINHCMQPCLQKVQRLNIVRVGVFQLGVFIVSVSNGLLGRAPGLTRRGISSVNSKKLPGQPCINSKGRASLCFDLSWTKCRSMEFREVRKWCRLWFSSASCFLQSYVVCQYCNSSCNSAVDALVRMYIAVRLHF